MDGVRPFATGIGPGGRAKGAGLRWQPLAAAVSTSGSGGHRRLLLVATVSSRAQTHAHGALAAGVSPRRLRNHWRQSLAATRGESTAGAGQLPVMATSQALAVENLRQAIAKAEAIGADVALERAAQVSRDEARQGARRATRELRKMTNAEGRRVWCALPNGVLTKIPRAEGVERVEASEARAGREHDEGDRRLKQLVLKLETECGGAAPGAAGSGLIKALVGLGQGGDR